MPGVWLIATVFMPSQDMTMLGDIGYSGLAMRPGFAIIVHLAHTVSGLILSLLVGRGKCTGYRPSAITSPGRGESSTIA